MTIARKKSRPITVDGINFRYTISVSSPDKDLNFQLTATIQIAQGKGSKLRVSGLITRDYWLDFPSISKDDTDYPVIMPHHIEMFIRHGLRDSWKPEIPGPVHQLNLENKEVFK